MNPHSTRVVPRLAALLLAGVAAVLSSHRSVRAEDAPKPPAVEAPGFAGFHVESAPMLSDVQKKALGITANRGSLAVLVVAGGPADLAGLRVGDVIRRIDGKDVADDGGSDRYDPIHKRWRAGIRESLAAFRAGKPVELVVERLGATPSTRTLSIVPVLESVMHRLQGGTDAPFPSPATAGPARPFDLDFQGLPSDATLPPGLQPFEGRWQVVGEPALDSATPGLGHRVANQVLRQDLPVLPWAAIVATGPGRACADGRASVRFLPVAGGVDASAGVIVRAQSGRDYYLARANALEDNFVLYVTKDNVRTELKSIRLTPPAAGRWHTLEVSFSGPTLRATLDGDATVEATDSTFSTGWCGLWTKADSVTLFDDLAVRPAGATEKAR